MRRTPPSTRNSVSSSRRAPLAWRSSSTTRSSASRRQRRLDRLAGAIGLAKRRSTLKSGAAKARRDRAARQGRAARRAGRWRRRRSGRRSARAAASRDRRCGAGRRAPCRRKSRRRARARRPACRERAGRRPCRRGRRARCGARKRASAQAARGESARPSATRQPGRGEARLDLGDQPVLAAEQMRDAGDVEHQPVARRRARPAACSASRRRRGARAAAPRPAGSASPRRARDGARARRRASGPAPRPSRAAFASTPTSRRAFLTVATTASGARGSTSCARRARSVVSRGSHRERNRRFVKTSCSSLRQVRRKIASRRGRAAAPRADVMRALTSRAAKAGGPGSGAPAAGRSEMRARRGGDLEARLGGAGEPVGRAIGARLHQQRRRRPGARGEQQAARDGEVVGFAAARLRRPPRPARRSSARPPSPGTAPARRARARRRAGRDRAHGRRAPAHRARPSRQARNPRRSTSAAARRTAMKRAASAQREAHGRRAVAGAAGAISCRPSPARPPPSARSSARVSGSWRGARAVRRPRASLDLGDGAAQTRHPLSPVASDIRPCPICSLFVLVLNGDEAGVKGALAANIDRAQLSAPPSRINLLRCKAGSKEQACFRCESTAAAARAW